MGQFAVYKNKNPRTKSGFPLLVDVQTDLLEDLQTRVVIPLTRAAAPTRNPLLAGVSRSDLGSEAGSLLVDSGVIPAAMDFLLVGF